MVSSWRNTSRLYFLLVLWLPCPYRRPGVSHQMQLLLGETRAELGQGAVCLHMPRFLACRTLVPHTYRIHKIMWLFSMAVRDLRPSTTILVFATLISGCSVKEVTLGQQVAASKSSPPTDLFHQYSDSYGFSENSSDFLGKWSIPSVVSTSERKELCGNSTAICYYLHISAPGKHSNCKGNFKVVGGMGGLLGCWIHGTSSKWAASIGFRRRTTLRSHSLCPISPGLPITWSEATILTM